MPHVVRETDAGIIAPGAKSEPTSDANQAIAESTIAHRGDAPLSMQSTVWRTATACRSREKTCRPAVMAGPQPATAPLSTVPPPFPWYGAARNRRTRGSVPPNSTHDNPGFAGFTPCRKNPPDRRSGAGRSPPGHRPPLRQ